MMPENLPARIKSVGHIRVVIRPTVIPESLSIMSARELVQKTNVSLRGWDYPHVAIRNDEHGGYEYSAEFSQDWCKWYNHIEFWRMYKSGQFLHYKALREDLGRESSMPAGPVLAVGSFMYTITEIAEFAHRLRAAGLYKEGATIQVTLGNCLDRRLWVENPTRMDFMYPMTSRSQSIKVERSLGTSELLLGDPKDISFSMIAEFLNAFGWTPPADLISSTQTELYSLKLGRDR